MKTYLDEVDCRLVVIGQVEGCGSQVVSHTSALGFDIGGTLSPPVIHLIFRPALLQLLASALSEQDSIGDQN